MLAAGGVLAAALAFGCSTSSNSQPTTTATAGAATGAEHDAAGLVGFVSAAPPPPGAACMTTQDLTSEGDATRTARVLCDDVPPYRRMMLYLMRGANESVVNFTQEIDVTETVDFIGRWNATLPHRRITPFHVCVWAVVRTLEARPQLNRFVSGGKTWQRDGAWITYAAKKRMADESSRALARLIVSTMTGR